MESAKLTSREKYEICNTCPSLFRPTRQCKECKCFMPLKVRVPGTSCPLGKW